MADAHAQPRANDRPHLRNAVRPRRKLFPALEDFCRGKGIRRASLTGAARPSERRRWQRWRPTGWQLVIDDAQLFNDKLQEWQGFGNYHRPHGSLGGQTPCERLLQKAVTEPAPE